MGAFGIVLCIRSWYGRGLKNESGKSLNTLSASVPSLGIEPKFVV